jgi:hypothetical protein
MRGSLGEKIGEGASLGVHTWAPGQVVKLSKAGSRGGSAGGKRARPAPSLPPASRRRGCLRR